MTHTGKASGDATGTHRRRTHAAIDWRTERMELAWRSLPEGPVVMGLRRERDEIDSLSRQTGEVVA